MRVPGSGEEGAQPPDPNFFIYDNTVSRTHWTATSEPAHPAEVAVVYNLVDQGIGSSPQKSVNMFTHLKDQSFVYWCVRGGGGEN